VALSTWYGVYYLHLTPNASDAENAEFAEEAGEQVPEQHITGGITSFNGSYPRH